MSPPRFTWLHGLGFTALIVITAVAGWLMISNRPLALDASGCPHRPPTATVAVLSDASDPLSAIDTARLARSLDLGRSLTAPGERLIITALRRDAVPAELFARCNPGSAGNDLTENVRKITQRYEATFMEPLRLLTGRLAEEPALETSPLIESITALSRRPDFDGTVGQRTLIILGDMLQHSPGVLSHYKRGDLWRSFETSPLGKGDLPDLRQVNVIIDYVARPNQRLLQGAEHRAFWRNWFSRAGAASVRFLGVPDAPMNPPVFHGLVDRTGQAVKRP